MKTHRLLMSVCILAMGLALQSVAYGYTVDATTLFTLVNSSGSNTSSGCRCPRAASFRGQAAPGPAYDWSVSAPLVSITWSAAAVQDYGIFYARASTQAYRDGPSSFEAFQTTAMGTFIQNLTIPAPVGVTNGSMGTMMTGWDVTGSSSSGTSGFAYLAMFATSSASLANTKQQHRRHHGQRTLQSGQPDLIYLWNAISIQSPFYCRSERGIRLPEYTPTEHFQRRGIGGFPAHRHPVQRRGER